MDNKTLEELFDESVLWFFDLEREDRKKLYFEHNGDIGAIVCADFTIKAVRFGYSPDTVLKYIRAEIYGL